MTGFDMTESIAPRSDQINFDDVAAQDITVTIVEAKAGTAEQPVDFPLVETPGRCYRPSKSMRRVMVAAWGRDAATYSGRRLTLYGDPTVKFGAATVGGIKIRAMSHLDKPLTVALTATRGKRVPHSVQPLPDAPTPAVASADGITQEQSRTLIAALKLVGLSDKDAALEHLSDVLKRPVASTKELTKDEAAQVIAGLAAADEPDGEDTLPVEGWPEAARPADAQ